MSHNPAMSTTDKFERHYRQQLSALVDGELSADESRFCCAAWPTTKNWPAATNAGSCAAMCCVVRRARRHRWILPRACAVPSPMSRCRRRSHPRVRRRAGAGVVARRLRHRSRRSPCSWRASVCRRPQRLPRRSRCSPPWRSCPPPRRLPPRPWRRRGRPSLARPPPTRSPRWPQRCRLPRWHPRAVARPRATNRSPAASRRGGSRRQPALASAAPASAAATAVAAPSNPFTHPDTTLQARPWPRAALSGAGDSPLNASFRQGGQGTAFYPFEPAPQGVASPAPSRPLPVQPPQD